MSDVALIISEIIRIDILIGFGFYSIIFFILKQFLRHNNALVAFDKSAIKVVIYFGIIWFILWLTRTISFYFELETEIEKQEYYNELTGTHIYAIWIQPLFWLFLSQLFRIRIVAKYLITRIIICILFVVTIEDLIILITSIHRDYQPSDWSISFNFTINPYWTLINWLFITIVFIILTLVYHFFIKMIKRIAK